VGGIVKTISATQWTIGASFVSLSPDIVVIITPTTKIYPNPAVGDDVVATGARDSTGKFVAVEIEKED
jgi:hypothetical protein